MDEWELGNMRYKEHPKEVVGGPDSGLLQSSDFRIRRASYYVWFLGAEECQGLRGSEVVRPVLQYLLEREREHEPEKVTLQVSGRGIKLLQQGVTSRAAAAGTTKHFIPCGALTHVQQEESPDDDIVSAVLLIYNPQTRCPVHVHAYRCDSTETATVLRKHLNQLLVRPEQQEKLAALETRLASRGILPFSSRASDGASSGSSVSSSGAGSGSGRVASGEKIATLYDSLAAELREKLGTRGGGGSGGGPLLLPPRDYDGTGRRNKKHSRGELFGSGGGGGARHKTLEDDSARSSGIGSDDAPSPTQEKDLGALDNQSSSDEEWATHNSAEVRGDAGLLLVQPPWRGGASRHPRPHRDRERKGGRKHQQQQQHQQPQQQQQQQQQQHFSPAWHQASSHRRHLSPGRITPVTKSSSSRRLKDRSISPVSPQDRFFDAREKFLSLERQRSAVECSPSTPTYHPEGIGRSTSWEVTPKGYSSQGHRGRERRRGHGSRDDLAWPKSDRDTGYGSRDALMKDRRSRDPRESKEIDHWRREGRKTPDVWEYRGPERTQSPIRGRARTPIRDHRVPRVRSPERQQEYLRAKSMHDLSQRRSGVDDDPRRRSLYDPAEDGMQERRRPFSSHTNLGPPSSGSSTASSPSRDARYNELPDHQRFPGLDRSTARQDPLDIRSSKRTFDYPVNGGHAPIHISRAQNEDYRKLRYDHGNGQFVRPAPVSTVHY